MLKANDAHHSPFSKADVCSVDEWMEQLPPPTPLREANSLLGNRAKLEEAWERDGYWFFRDVIDKEAVARLRGTYLTVLADLGHIRRGDQDAVWTGAGRADLPPYMAPIEELAAGSPWRDFVGDFAVSSFFQQLFGEPVVWLPMADLRAVEPGAPGMLFLHQDGFFYNSALAVRTAWFPLADISDDVGGLGLLEGLHRQPYIHDASRPPLYEPDLTKIPQDCWRSSPCAPGDVIIFDMGTPHFGILNRSDRFRLSLDVRFTPVSAPRPIVGEVREVTADYMCVEAGGVISIPLDELTWVRGGKGKEDVRLTRADIGGHYKRGDKIIMGLIDGMARFIRHPHE